MERLRELCAPLGIGVHIVPMAQYGGQTVSSTRIRAALEEGRLDDANAMLGTPYAIDWPVVRGKGIGSGKLGTPTLNQNYPAAALQPCAGVYLTRIYLDGQWRPAATGIGKRPTVDSSENAAVTCETFVPDFSGNVYGQQPVLEFHKYFCPVRKFNSMDELAALIHHAADESKAYFVALNGSKINCGNAANALVFRKMLWYTYSCYRGPVWGVCLNGSNYPLLRRRPIHFYERGIYP